MALAFSHFAPSDRKAPLKQIADPEPVKETAPQLGQLDISFSTCTLVYE